MRKIIRIVLLALFATLTVTGAVAIWNGHRVAEEGFNLAWLLAGAIGTLLGLVGGFFTVKPRVDVGPLSTSFDSFPLELLFRVHNAGLFVLTDVKCEVSDVHMEANISARPTVLYTHDPEGRFDRQQEPQTFPTIQPGHGDTLDIRKMISLLQQEPDSASVSVRLSYGQTFWPIRSKQIYKYKLFRTADHKYHWSEVAAQ